MPSPQMIPSAVRRRLYIALAAFLAGALSGCDALLTETPDETEELAGLVPGLTAPQRALHLRGDGEFARSFGPADGLGPIFVAASCESCHVGDGKGHPLFAITRFGRDLPGGFDPMPSAGGPQLQDRAVLGYIAERLPSAATGVTRLIAPAVSGLGFLDAVDDTTLQRLADPTDANGDGISGRLQLLDPTSMHANVFAIEQGGAGATGTRGTLVGGQHIGRFGKKALAVNLLQQVATAYHEDMGVTSELLPLDVVNPAVGDAGGDGVPEPEAPMSVVHAVTFYMKTLKVPPRRDSTNADVLAGEALFAASDCAKCHVPTMRTGASAIAALDRKTFHPFTDLLLHDMGSELDDGYTEGSATTREWRTAPLWGLGLAAAAQGGRMHLLHDGRASSVESAITFHGGEAAVSRAWFNALSAVQRRQLLAYLHSL